MMVDAVRLLHIYNKWKTKGYKWNVSKKNQNSQSDREEICGILRKTCTASLSEANEKLKSYINSKHKEIMFIVIYNDCAMLTTQTAKNKWTRIYSHLVIKLRMITLH